jgi:putative aldouronate transport system substrate-binding protein
MATANDSKAYQEAEKRTNIHIEWQHPTQGNEVENFNLVIASQNYPDALISGGPTYYVGGYDKFIDDQIILDLKDLIAANAPDYDALRNSTDDIRKRTMTDMGRVPYFRTINKTLQPSFMGDLVRQDWLDAAGYKGMPETYTEFHDMLVALKDKSAVAPLYFFQKTGLEEQLMVGFGVNGSWYQADGKVKFGPIEQGFKDYVTTMNQWYSEGLIDPEFYSRPGIFAGDTANILNGDFGVFFHFYTMIDVLELQAADQNFSVSAVTPPVVNKGDKRHMTYFGIPDSMVGGGNATITTACKDPVTFAKWWNYFYTEEGSLLGNYGTEEAYKMVDGKPVASDLILANPDGLSVNDARSLYTITPFHPKWYDWERELTPAMSDKAKNAGSVWDANWENTQTLPDITVSSDESAEYSAIYNDISTLVQENTAQFITGQKPMSEFDAFVEQIKSMNISRCTEIQQAALDRYNNR